MRVLRNTSRLSMHLHEFFKLVLVVLCLLGGIGGIFYFANQENYRMMWECVILMFACLSLLDLNLSVMRGQLLTKYSRSSMRRLQLLAALLGVASLVITLLNLLMGYTRKEGFRIDGCYFAAVPSFLSMLWYFVLALEARSHLKVIPDNVQIYVLLLEEGNTKN